MGELIENIKNLKPVYIVFITLGGVAAVGVHFFSRKKYKDFTRISFVYAAALILALFFSFAIHTIFNELIRKNNPSAYYLTNFSFLTTFIMFLLAVILLSIVCGLDFNKMKEPFIASILSFLTFAKMGCFFNGCCVSRNFGGVILHFNLYESIFAMGFLLVYFFGKKPIFYSFLLSYMSYRFISEFFRETYAGQIILLGTFTPTQILSFITWIGAWIGLYRSLKKKKS